MRPMKKRMKILNKNKLCQRKTSQYFFFKLKIQKKIAQQEALTLEDINFMKENRNYIKLLKSVRSNTNRDSTLRKTVVKELIYDVDPFNE